MSNHLLGYQIGEEIYASKNARVFRAVRLVDSLPVILKTPNNNNPPAEQIAQFEREYELNQQLNLDGLVDVYELGYDDHRPVMALEDFDAQSLATLYRGSQMKLDQFWPLAIRIVHIVGALHHHHVIHKDINPANILYNPHNGVVKLSDLGIASRLSRETPTLTNVNMLEGTLPYLAPEQTGRMNRDIDYRADFYALGATFYELLTGHPPFAYQTAEELVHAHLAETPATPHERRSDIPRLLSDIIMRLLAKNAEERYQLAYGLQADLVECWSRWSIDKRVAPFELGLYDVSDQFHLPQGLYGRTAEIAFLTEAFQRVTQGQAEILFIGGYAGIGKSALVGELTRPVTTSHGFFGQGKFDQFQKREPYAPVISALRQLVRQLLSEREEQLMAWRERLQSALGTNTAVLLDLIPELSPVLGTSASPTASTSPPLHQLLVRLIDCFTASERPLVIFLDDLQWGDSASFTLLVDLLTAVVPRYLFFITAYRDNEIGPTHPLLALQKELQARQFTVRELTLAPLSPANVQQYVADTLRRQQSDVVELSQLISRKTGGNPFFLGIFLQNLYTAGALTFDPHPAHWEWQMSEIIAQGMTDNVIDLLSNQVGELPSATQRIVQLAASIGNQFDLALLAQIAEQGRAETATQLWPAIQTDLIIPLDESYRLLETAPSAAAVPNLNVRFRFVHDRVQQAAYEAITQRERASLHWHIGQLLWDALSPAERDPAGEVDGQLFTLVNNLNLGRDEATTAGDKWWLVRLNWQAGQRAKQAAAYETAYHYVNTAVSLLAQLPDTHPTLTQQLYVTATESAFLTSRYEQMQAWASIALTRIATAVEKTPVYDVLLQAGMIQREYQQAADLGLAALADLGLILPKQTTAEAIEAEHTAVRALWAEQDILSLAHRPATADPRIISQMQLLHRLNSLMPFAYPQAYPLIALAQVRLSLEDGTSRYSANVFAIYGVTLLADQGDIEAGYQFARLALAVLRKHDAREFAAHVEFAFNALIRFWREPFNNTIEPLLKTYTTGLETGDHLHGPLGALVHFLHSFWHGRELDQIEKGLQTYEAELARLKSAYLTPRFQLYQQMVRALRGHTAGPSSLSAPSDNPTANPDDTYDETAVLASFTARRDQTSIASFQMFKLILHYLYDEYEQADQAATAVGERLSYFKSGYWVLVYNFYHSLTLLAQCVALPPDDPRREANVTQVNAYQKQLRQWMRHTPHNVEPYWHLVEAERCRLFQELGQARLHYEKAITLARHNDYMNLRALAHERAGRYFLEEGHKWLARFFLSEAHYAYTRWGAHAKADWLRGTFPNIVVHSTDSEDISTTRIRATISHSTSRGIVSTALDLSAITRASQAIAAEVVPNKLQSKMMEVVLENAGAQRGLLLLPVSPKQTTAVDTPNTSWQIQVEGIKRGQAIETTDTVPLTANHAPLTLINYVIRTQESIVLANALRDDPLLAQDPYVQANRLRSALCLPLMNRGKLVGVLYLENNLASGAFTDDHLGMLHILASQTAVSLDNARLYEGLEKMVAERTAELEHAVAELDAFAHTVAHDLKAPLSGILGYADMLRELDDELDAVERADIFERLIRGGIHMRDIIDGLLLLAQTRHDAIQTSPVEMGNVIDDLLNRFAYLISERQARITQPDAWPTVMGYMPWITEVWANYLSNALKYGGDAPHIVLGYTPQENGQIRFWVQDHGRGMTAEQVARIFAPFVQVGQRYSDSHGLGLSIARRITERLGGEVGVNSEVGQGSTFWFTLPAVT